MNDKEKLEEVKKIVADFQQLLNDKEILSNELIRFQKMLSESNKIIDKLKNMKIHSNDERLVSELEKQKKYIETINQIASKFNEVNTQIEQYDRKKIEMINDYILLSAEFVKITEEIKLAERLSKKSDEPKIDIVNAEGRKKSIDSDLIDYYNDLIFKKKKISKQILKMSHMINNLDVDKLIVPNEPNENISYLTIDSRKKEIDSENILKTMSVDEKIYSIENQMQRIINTCYLPKQGKKRLVKFGEQTYYLPVKYVGRFNNLKGELRKLAEEKKKEEKPIAVEKFVVESNQSVDYTFEYNKKIAERAEKISEILKKIAIENDNYQRELRAAIEREKIRVAEEENKKDVSKEEIIPVKKVKSDKNMFKKIKVAALAISTAITVAASSIIGISLFNRKKSENGFENKKNSIVLENGIVNSDKLAVNLSNNSEVILGDTFKENVAEEDFIIEQAEIKEGAKIYTNEYDASNKENGLNPYYSYDEVRVMDAVVVMMPDGTPINVSVDNQEQIQDLVNKGGKITAYLAANNEGFYNADEVKESGKTR